ncbi:hypothetical protein CEXT_425271 [Caerostris extrusa]|uniref:Uncharacterized protein n=1 Tax=Caerostris extrusa TaxID=172846 RepID=A0AAV4UXA3_CAEEX|nr:hypothetical protein CEXT_425271 [Caerostris extrusa]
MKSRDEARRHPLFLEAKSHVIPKTSAGSLRDCPHFVTSSLGTGGSDDEVTFCEDYAKMEVITELAAISNFGNRGIQMPARYPNLHWNYALFKATSLTNTISGTKPTSSCTHFHYVFGIGSTKLDCPSMLPEWVTLHGRFAWLHPALGKRYLHEINTF